MTHYASRLNTRLFSFHPPSSRLIILLYHEFRKCIISLDIYSMINLFLKISSEIKILLGVSLPSLPS
jgi:hypothetical protein